MALKSATTQEQVIVVNATPLDDDEADYLMSRERERTGGIRFEEFLKRHPRDVRKFIKPLGKKPGPHWKSRLLSETQREYDGLAEPVRAVALAVLYELAADPLLKGSSAVGSHRGYYRKAFYRDQCRMIYRVSKSRREVVVTRIRRKDEKTYVGHEQR